MGNVEGEREGAVGAVEGARCAFLKTEKQAVSALSEDLSDWKTDNGINCRRKGIAIVIPI